MKQNLCYLFAVLMLMVSCGPQEAPQNAPSTTGSEPVMTEGHKLFINNCIQCHSIKQDKTGPKLEGVLARWDNDTARLRNFIHNSQEAVNAGDPSAVAVFHEWNEVIMTPMPHLTNGDIYQILSYIANVEE